MTPADVTAALAADPGAGGLVLDFDGTLAPIVSDPASSQMLPGIGPVLEAIAERLAVVAIVSGRPAAFLGERAALRGVRLLGLYGTEQWVDGRSEPHPDAARFEPALDEARDRLVLALAGRPGVVLEDKGLAVALHWRTAEDRAAAGAFVAELIAEVAADTGLAQEPGKLVAELRPPLDRDKGTAVTQLVDDHGLRTVVFVGDDRGDLPGLTAAGAHGGSAIVVSHGDETPEEVLAAADVVVEGPAGVAAWLRELADAL